MKKNTKFSTKRLFSNQLKQALYNTFIEAKKHRIQIIDSRLILYGLLKVKGGLASRALQKLYAKNSSFIDPTDTILFAIKANLKNKRKNETNININPSYPNFNRFVRRLLFFLIRSLKYEKHTILTTIDVLCYMLNNKVVKRFVNQCVKSY